jgi:hypothetical protein
MLEVIQLVLELLLEFADLIVDVIITINRTR